MGPTVSDPTTCAADGCTAAAFDEALIDRRWYCREHYPAASRYDTALHPGVVLCEHCHEWRDGITYFPEVAKWLCTDHRPGWELL